MTKSQATFVVVALVLTLAALAGIYYVGLTLYQTYQAKTAKGTILGEVTSLLGGA